ncbi:hypothetical protein DID78_03945 [Candidatus Marinamargulisbacteria bacterium SCGC AG-343-D04]|nr:hypothetical protein DID78_03945 [Candidatus Marinamargulisbacteria bacterium SCGC AG-343-D04]
MKQKGVSMIELLVSLTILALIAGPIFYVLKTALAVWQEGSSELETTKYIHFYLEPLSQKLHYARDISLVSEYNQTEGYIRYTDSFDRTFTIFYNSPANQTLFDSANSFAHSSVVFTTSEENTDPELLLQKVLQFSIVTYVEDPTTFNIVSANLTASIPYDEINSLKYVVKMEDSKGHHVLEQMVDLARHAREESDSLLTGDSATPFTSFESIDSFINVQSEPDELAAYSDRVFLTHPEETVMIENTGFLFSSISEALEHSVSGNTVLVAYKEEGYNENIIIPEGVTVKGGYSNDNWERNLQKYPSYISTREGISVGNNITAVVFMNSGSTIDGLNINAKDIINGIYAKDVSDITIKNNGISLCDNPIYLENSTATILQNSVTANQHSLVLAGTAKSVIKRNRFHSKTYLLKENVLISAGANITFANNHISSGYTALSLESISNSTFSHNVATKAQNFGVYVSNPSQLSFFNNIIVQNNIGFILNSSFPGDFASTDLRYNLLVNNIFGHVIDIGIDNSNILNSLSDFIWEHANPYFNNVKTFTLSSNSLLIDAGLHSDEVYIQDNPSKGTATNDIGLYGGGESGRIGPFQTAVMASSQLSSAILTAISSSFPGDHLFFEAGTYTLSSSLHLKPHQILSGEHAYSTTLINQSNSAFIHAHDASRIETIHVDANDQTAIVVSDVDDVDVASVVISDASIGISLEKTATSPRFCTFYDSNTGVRFGQEAIGNVSYSLFDSVGVAFENNSGLSVDTHYNILKDVSTHTSGPVTTASNETSTQTMRDPASGIFHLHPSSNAINVDATFDAGAIPFYTYTGTLIFPLLSSNINRHYQSVDVTFAHPQSRKAVLSDLYFTFKDGDTSFQPSDRILIDSETLDTYTLELPESIISDSLIFQVHMTAYTYNKSPTIESIQLHW